MATALLMDRLRQNIKAQDNSYIDLHEMKQQQHVIHEQLSPKRKVLDSSSSEIINNSVKTKRNRTCEASDIQGPRGTKTTTSMPMSIPTTLQNLTATRSIPVTNFSSNSIFGSSNNRRNHKNDNNGILSTQSIPLTLKNIGSISLPPASKQNVTSRRSEPTTKELLAANDTEFLQRILRKCRSDERTSATAETTVGVSEMTTKVTTSTFSYIPTKLQCMTAPPSMSSLKSYRTKSPRNLLRQATTSISRKITATPPTTTMSKTSIPTTLQNINKNRKRKCVQFMEQPVTKVVYNRERPPSEDERASAWFDERDFLRIMKEQQMTIVFARRLQQLHQQQQPVATDVAADVATAAATASSKQSLLTLQLAKKNITLRGIEEVISKQSYGTKSKRKQEYRRVILNEYKRQKAMLNIKEKDESLAIISLMLTQEDRSRAYEIGIEDANEIAKENK